MKTLKVFAQKSEFADVIKQARLVEKYQAFVVVQADDAVATQLQQRYPLEDISEQYLLRLPGSTARAPKPRTDYRGEEHLSRGPHHYVVQFIGPIKPIWLRRVRATGAVLREPYGGFSYVVLATPSVLPRIGALPCVRWLGHLPHASRIAPATTALPRQRNHEGAYAVEIFSSDDTARIARAARRIGFKLLSSDARARLLLLASDATVAGQREQVKLLSAVHGVRQIRQRVIRRTSNNVAAGIMGNSYTAASASGLRLAGEGEIIAVCDTGLDTGDAASIHPDFAGRVLAIKSYPIDASWNSYITNPGGNDGAADLDSGHGTHVSGSVLGNGTASTGQPDLVRGHAYKAKLVFQAIEQEIKWKASAPANLQSQRYMLAGLPSNLGPLFQFAYAQGARIHSNSWGGGQAGAYDDTCRQFDQFVWDHKDFCFVVAAGNDGSDHNGDGVVDLGSVSSPGTAKNCITVGACENERPAFKADTYGAMWPSDFPVAPLKTDPVADSRNDMVAFSSRGPTTDGRIKPDVVAPGTFILSTRSSKIAPNNFGWSAYPPNIQRYFYDGGTSMATPLTSGAVAVLRQFLRTQRGIAKPTAALLKSLLIAGASRMPKIAPASVVLDPHQGYGRVDLDGATRQTLLTQEGAGLSTGQKSSLTVKVPTAGKTLRIALCYSDYPGEQLINNLNLIVTSPTGKRYTGNQPTSGATLSLDTSNNVELVVAQTAAKGDWTVDVVASNVSVGPQDFALAAVLR